MPAWGEEVEGTDSLQAPGGQAYNAAAALCGLGVGARLIGAVGRDPAGEAIVASAQALGVDVSDVAVDPASPTAVTTALVRVDGERAFASDFGAQRAYGRDQILGAWDRIAPVSVLCLAGLFNMPGFLPEDAGEVLRRARAAGITTVLDTGWDPAGWPSDRVRAIRRLLAGVDVFLPNHDEARALTGCEDPVAAARALHADGARTVVIKCGAGGSIGLTDGHCVRADALEVTVRDAVGAGDTFDAGVIAAHLGGASLGHSLALGTAAAALRISGDPGRWPSRDQALRIAAEVSLHPVGFTGSLPQGVG
jgi:sugar/nucleoside kinase (ribokinase family)